MHIKDVFEGRRHRRRAAAQPAQAVSAHSVPAPEGSRGHALICLDGRFGLWGEFDVANRDELAVSAANFLHRCCEDDHTRRSSIDTSSVSSSVSSPTERTTALIDAAGVDFADASTLGVLVELRRRLSEAGIGLRIDRASSGLRRLCSLCDLEDLLGCDTPAPIDARASHPTQHAAGASRSGQA